MSGDMSIRARAVRNPRTMVIVAGNTLVRTCIVYLLKFEFSGWNFMDIASTAQLESAHGRDVHLIAIDMAGRTVASRDLRDDLDAIGRHFPKAAIALLSGTDDILAESQALEMGVRGYFTSSLPIEVALAGIRLVLAGGVFCPHPLSTLKYSSGNGSGNGAAVEPAGAASPKDEEQREMNGFRREGVAGFTRREADVLAELQRGHSNKTIAEKLNLSGNTVKMHLQHIMRKLHVQNRTEVVVLLRPKETGWRDAAAAAKVHDMRPGASLSFPGKPG